MPLDTYQYPEYEHFLFNLRPIIGILTQPTCWPKIYDPSQYSYIASSYVRFIEQSGARVIPIKYDLPRDNLTQLIKHINGILIPGGSSDLFTQGYDSELTTFANTAKFLIEETIKINDMGEYFPLWGSSLGFESLIIATSNESKIIEQFNSSNFSQSLKFNKATIQSKLFSKMPYQMKKYINDNRGLFFNHKTGISINKFVENEKLRTLFDILTVSNDKNGQTFISSIEAKDYPIYGTQFQPEKNAFEWKDHLEIDHSPESIQIQQYFSEFFVSEARKNARQYENIKEERKDLIYNYFPVQISESFISIYVFSAPTKQELNKINKKKIIQQQIQITSNKTQSLLANQSQPLPQNSSQLLKVHSFQQIPGNLTSNNSKLYNIQSLLINIKQNRKEVFKK